jgi:amino acid transporter
VPGDTVALEQELEEGDTFRPVGLTTAEASGVSLAGLSPVMAMGWTTAFAASEAGGATPLSFVLGFVGALALGYVITRFASRFVASGVAYTYVRAAFGPLPGFVAGWLYASSWALGVSVNLAIGTYFLQTVLQAHGVQLPWALVVVVLFIGIAALNWIGVRPSVRSQVAAELGSMILISILFALVLVSGGANGISLQPFNPANSLQGPLGIGFGMIYGFAGFAGFEGAASLGHEARDPSRTIPRAISYSLIGAGLFFVFCTFAMSIGYGPANGAAWAADGDPVGNTIGKFVGSGWGQVADLLIVVSAVSGALGQMTLASRVWYDVGRLGIGFKRLVHIDPKFNTPTRIIGIIAIVDIVLVAVVALLGGGPLNLIGFLGTATTLALISMYAAISIAGFRVLNRAGSKQAAPTGLARAAGLVLPVVAFALLAFALYASLFPVPAFPINVAPYAAVVVAIVGFGVYKWARSRGIEVETAFSEG